MECINEVINLKIKDIVYPIKVVEDPFAETSWENRGITAIGFREDGKRMVRITEASDLAEKGG